MIKLIDRGIGKLDSISRDVYKKFLKLLSPFAPHIAEELWQNLTSPRPSPKERGKFKVFPFGGGAEEVRSIHLSNWPKWDESLIQDEEIKIAVQVNGKVRTEIIIQTDEQEEIVKQKALRNKTIIKYIGNKIPLKAIYVKNRLINIVI